MNNLSPERKKAVVLASCCACLSSGPILLRGHHLLFACWLALDVLLIVAALAQFRKAIKSERCGR